MSRERVFTTVVGLATIVSALMYAVDNQWIDGVPELNVASKFVGLVQPDTSAGEDDQAVGARPQPAARIGGAKPASRPVTRRRATRSSSRRRTVSIFAVAKDIPHPNQQR